MRRGFVRVSVAVVVAVVLTGCGSQGSDHPELTVYADGSTATVSATRYCDVVVSDCEHDADAETSMALRPGQPAQISVPGEMSETPWLVNVQSVTAAGEPLEPQQEVFTPADGRLAYTARPDNPDDRLLVVEVQQLGAAFVQQEGAAEPELLARGLWAVSFDER